MRLLVVHILRCQWSTLGVAVLTSTAPDSAVLSPLQVVLVAHSQGTIIAGDVLHRLQQRVEVDELDQASKEQQQQQ